MYLLASLFAFASLVVAADTATKDDLLVAIKTEVSHFDTPMPKNTLVTNIHPVFSYNLGTASSDTLVATLKNWSLPTDVQVQMEMAAYATNEQFQTFSFITSLKHTYYEHYIVSAKHVLDTITLAYIHVVITSDLVPQYTMVHVHECHRCWVVARCCSTVTRQIERGLVPDELETVFVILQATAYDTFVKHFPTDVFLHYASHF
jgi:hypothetical protein